MNTALPAVRSISAGILSAMFAFGLIVPVAAFAELSDEPMLGPGLRSRPAYDGSGSQHIELVPVVRYFGEHWFARSTQGVLEGGARIELAPGLHAGAQLAYEPGRKASESDFLKSHDVPDVKIGASVGVHLEWDHKFGPMPITFLARARQRTDSDRGAQVDLRLSAGIFQSGRVAAGVFT
ncbi:MAG TPA: MipA/OmpV family protein, partial [Burkholderiales bacterium]